MPLNAGKLNRQVTIQEATEVQDAYGEPVESWANIATNPTVWAAFVPDQGSERFNSDRRIDTVQAIFRIRHRDDVTAEMRLQLDDNTYWHIKSVISMDGWREGLEILAEKGSDTLE